MRVSIFLFLKVDVKAAEIHLAKFIINYDCVIFASEQVHTFTSPYKKELMGVIQLIQVFC